MAGGWLGALSLGLIAGSSVTFACMRLGRKEEVRASPQPSPPVLKKPAVVLKRHTSVDPNLAPFGLPLSSFTVKHYKGFALGYDRRLRTSTFAYEKLTAESIQGDARRPTVFIEDKTEEAMYRVRNSDYMKTGLDRGHLVPAADFKASQSGMNETFVLSNICPQDPKLNRGYWSDLERFVRELTKEFDEVHAVTGTLYLPEHNAETGEWRANFKFVGHTCGEEAKCSTQSETEVVEAQVPLIPVPTHMYKVVLGIKRNSPTALAAFVLPNTEIKAGTPLGNFQVSIPMLEVLSGHQFFPELLHKKESAKSGEAKNLCKEVSCDLRARWKAATKSVQEVQ